MIQPKEKLSELFVDPRQYTQANNFPDPRSLKIYDTTLRDGEQMPGVAMSPQQKYKIAKELSALGCHIIDMGFPASSPGERTALQLVLDGKHRGEIREDLEILVMCRATQADIDLTIKTIEKLNFSPSEVTFLIFTSASSLHCKYKLGPMLMKRAGQNPDDLFDTPLEFFHEANKEMISEAISYARSQGVVSIEFGTEDASRTKVEPLIDLVRCAVEAGATRYIFPDTTGSLTPEATRSYCQALTNAFPQIERASHFHNDFDLATINVITGVFHGFTTFSTTINGLGERAGNAPLHSVVASLKYLYGLEIPNFQYDRLWHVKKIVEEITGIPVQAHEPVIGYNVYSHESGIHTHGVNIFRGMYEPIPYEQVGGRARFVYGKHSGSNSLSELLAEHASDIDCEIDHSFTLELLSEIKRLREATTYTNDTAGYVNDYYQNLDKLRMTEDEVVALAKDMAVERKQPRTTVLEVARSAA